MKNHNIIWGINFLMNIFSRHKILLAIVFTSLTVNILFTTNCLSQSIIDEISLGMNHSGIAVNSSSNKIYAADLNGSISVIDAETNDVIRTIDIPESIEGSPRGIAVNEDLNLIYATNINSNSVSVIDGANDVLIDTVSVGEKPVSITVNPITNLIYVANTADNTISVINGLDNQVVDLINLAEEIIENKLELLSNESSDIKATNSFNPFIDTGVFSIINGIAVNPNSNRIYAAIDVIEAEEAIASGASFSHSIIVIDGEDNSVIERVELEVGGGDFFFAETYGMEVNPDTNKVYVATKNLVVESGRNIISVIDGTDNRIATKISLDTDLSESGVPFGLAINSSLNKIYVANIGRESCEECDKSIFIIDGFEDKLMGEIETINWPIAIDVNSITNLIYITNKDSGTITVVDGEKRNLNELKVSPSSSKGSLLLKEAIVKAIDENGKLLPEVEIKAVANGFGAKVAPATMVTDVNGASIFKYRFGFTTKNGEIIFSSDRINTSIVQE